MNRIISLSVEDMYIKYTGEAFGATGSHNAVTLRMTFGPAWEGTAKTAYFTDALGNTSVALVLGLDTLVDGAYEVDVPSEALKYAGEATVTIKGVLTSGDTTTKAITTAAGHFRVLNSELPESAGNAGTITPSDKDQLQAEIAGMETLFTTVKAAAEAAAANAQVSETNAKTSETAAASSASSAEASKTAAAESATTATAQASAADASAAKSAASQKAAQAAETNAKASEKAAAESQASAEKAAAESQASAAAAAKSAQTAQGASSAATNAASSANQSATAASGSASQAQVSAAAAAQSAVSVDGINKTAQSWAVGGTGTRPGEDTDNAKYWAEQAQAVVGGDFATKVEAQGYVTAHNQDTAAHADIRAALAGKETAGAAATVQSNLTAHAGNTTVHVTAAQKTTWDGKAAGKHASQHGKNGTDPLTPTAIGAVGYDAAQSLTDDQKTQARGNINAAPGGFGLGGVLVDAPENSEGFADANLITATGFYRAVRNVLYGGWHYIIHLNYDSATALQLAAYVSGEVYGAREKRLNVWGDWEHTNPPMELGIEYRTTERYLGKPVYVKLFDCGTIPAQGTHKDLVFSPDVDSIVSVTAYSPIRGNTLPYYDANGVRYSITGSGSTVMIWNYSEPWMDTNVRALIKYTKTTN